MTYICSYPFIHFFVVAALIYMCIFLFLKQTFYVCRIDKRSKYSRRREFQHDTDVDYINERNMEFNRKTACFYDKYTAEIKQNLKRGTAI